jgi:hypothetical protein
MIFLKNHLTISHEFLIYNPTNSVKSFLFFTSSQTLVIFQFFYISHLSMCKAMSYCGFGLHFSED